MKILQVLGSELPRSISLQAPTGRILAVTPVGERTAPHPALSPSDGERGKTRWQQGRARPLTPALSPSDGEREKRDCAAAGGTHKMCPFLGEFSPKPLDGARQWLEAHCSPAHAKFHGREWRKPALPWLSWRYRNLRA